jgi:predicted RNA polymerase sigma factor
VVRGGLCALLGKKAEARLAFQEAIAMLELAGVLPENLRSVGRPTRLRM